MVSRLIWGDQDSIGAMQRVHGRGAESQYRCTATELAHASCQPSCPAMLAPVCSGRFGVVVASDCTYQGALLPNILRTVDATLVEGGGGVAYICHERRYESCSEDW